MSVTKRCNGDVNPCRFVKLATADDSVTQSGTNEEIHGISQKDARDAPIPSASTLAGAAGDEIEVHLPPEEDILLEIGSGGVSYGNRITSDTNGKGIAMGSTAATKYNVGAVALEDMAENGFCRVRVHLEAVTFPA